MQNFSKEDITKLYNTSLMQLVLQAQAVHQKHFPTAAVQKCELLSIKTGGCPEDCGYCSQSMHHQSNLKSEKLLSLEQVKRAANEAKASGATRLCMGAAWRDIKDGPSFERVLDMVRQVSASGLQACCTLGMLTVEQANRLKEAGLHSYNHNIDTSENHYSKIVSTRTFSERLETLQRVRQAGINVCSGVILGLGEQARDHIDMLHTLANLDPYPESVPINALVPIQGTPMAQHEEVEPLLMIRMIALARILMPSAMVRLSAGRLKMDDPTQLLCFLAGANSIFSGETLLTTANPSRSRDEKLFSDLGLEPLQPA